MTNYYIEINGLITLVSDDKELLQNTIEDTPNLPDDIEIKETERPLAMSDDYTHYIFTDTPEYEAEQVLKAKVRKIEELKLKLEELDKQRIRALCEPSNRTDDQTWLEYYNEQIINIRREIQSLQN